MEEQVHGPRSRPSDRTGSSILNCSIKYWRLLGLNFTNRLATDVEVNLIFGNEDVIQLDVDCLFWPELAVASRFFSSKTEAKKNGWEGPVPWGFGQRKFGNKGFGVWFYNALPALSSP